MANENEITENEKIKETELENKLSKNKLKDEESENREIAGNNRRKVESVEVRNKEIELEVRERWHANKTGTILKATIRSIETISKPRDKDGQSKDILQKHNIDTEIINSTHKGMLSPNTENTVGYWRILEEEENLDLDKIKCRELELEYWERERGIRRSETKK